MKAEDFLRSKGYDSGEEPTEGIKELLCEFAKLRVQIALENAYNIGSFKGWTNSSDDNEHKRLFVVNVMSRNPII